MIKSQVAWIQLLKAHIVFTYFIFHFYWYWYLQSVRVIVQNKSNLTRVCLFPNPANNNQLQSNCSLSLSFSLPEGS